MSLIAGQTVSGRDKCVVCTRRESGQLFFSLNSGRERQERMAERGREKSSRERTVLRRAERQHGNHSRACARRSSPISF